jgi:hypothetical protein
MSTRERPRLGRGLRDVSSYFLSDAPGADEEKRAPSAVEVVSICVFHGSSPARQSFLAVNLALEAARRRRGVRVWDCMGEGGPKVERLASSVVTSGEGTGPFGQDAFVHLYGLPRIDIHDAASSPYSRDAAMQAPHPAKDEDALGGMLVVVNAEPRPGFFLRGDPVDHVLVASSTEELSLLKCYACIKAVLSRSPAAGVWMALEAEDAEGSRACGRILGKFSGLVGRVMGVDISYLGELIHDELMDRSIGDAMPIVLMKGESPARDSVERLCARLLNGVWGPGGGGEL